MTATFNLPARPPLRAASGAGIDGRRPPNRPPTREEIEALVSEKQIKLAELKRAQEELERERAGLEELRRRQAEFQTGRAEVLQHLTRGIGLLEEAGLNARRDAEEMARTLADFREALDKVQAINEQSWTQRKPQRRIDPRRHHHRKRPHGVERGPVEIPVAGGSAGGGARPCPGPGNSIFRPRPICSNSARLAWP